MKLLKGLSALIALATFAVLPAGILSASPGDYETVRVTVDAPDTVSNQTGFTASVSISNILNLNAVQYDITFNSSVLRLDDITGGLIGSTSFPVPGGGISPREITPGHWRVVQFLGLESATGSGYLSELHFHPAGSSGNVSSIVLSGGILSGIDGPINAEWTGDTVRISPTDTDNTTPAAITGIVTDGEDGSVLAGAAVTCGEAVEVTGAGGSYTFIDVSEGSHTISCSSEGYETSTLNVTAVAGENVTADFALAKTPVKSVWAESIAFIKKGKNLQITVKVAGDGVVAGSFVQVKLENSGRVWHFAGNTDSSGIAGFMLGKAPDGDYLATVSSLVLRGYEWDKSRGILQSGYTLGGDITAGSDRTTGDDTAPGNGKSRKKTK